MTRASLRVAAQFGLISALPGSSPNDTAYAGGTASRHAAAPTHSNSFSKTMKCTKPDETAGYPRVTPS
jgi:hypothetical protein